MKAKRSSATELHRYLADREVHAKRVRLTNRLNFKLLANFPCYPENPSQYHLMHLKRHSAVTEVFALTDNLIATLQKNGVCTLFRRIHNEFKLFGYINHHPDEIVRSLYHNLACASLIVVSVYPADRKSVLRCRSIKLCDVETGKFQTSMPILTQELLCFPGWVEISEMNAKILTFTSQTQTYKVWDLATYAFQYEITSSLVEEEKILDIKASPGFLLVLYEPKLLLEQRVQKIRLLDVMDGRELYCYVHCLTSPNATGIKLVEQFGDSILIKEDDNGGSEDLLVINLRTQPLATPYRVEMTASRLDAFTILHRANVFLTFQVDGRIVSHDCFGKELCEMYCEIKPDVVALKSGKVLIAKDQETLLSVRKMTVREECEVAASQLAAGDEPTSSSVVEFKSCSTGEVLGKIQLLRCNANEVTCVCYDDEKMLLMIGFKDGSISLFH